MAKSESTKIEFGYFHDYESEQFAFYRIPKVLFTDEYFRNLSSDAKVLYGLMLDRMALSIRHQWFDEEGNELNAHGIAMAGIKVDINPIAEERITLAEYMKESEAYLDQKEIEKLAVDLDNFSYEYDTYEYKDIVENREEQVKKITEDILNKKTGCLKDWLVEVSEESDIDSDVITARSLLSRLENAETFSIFTRQSEQEQPEATISFYVAECMEFPVMGEYHNNLTLEEAIKNL